MLLDWTFYNVYLLDSYNIFRFLVLVLALKICFGRLTYHKESVVWKGYLYLREKEKREIKVKKNILQKVQALPVFKAKIYRFYSFYVSTRLEVSREGNKPHTDLYWHRKKVLLFEVFRQIGGVRIPRWQSGSRFVFFRRFRRY